MVSQLLGPGLNNDANLSACVASALGAYPGVTAGSGYGSGSRYQHFALAVVKAGLTETLHGTKNIISKYIGTVAACLHFEADANAFDALRAACTARLERIAEPLEALYAAEGLSEKLGGVGLDFKDALVRLDDEGLLPMPPKFLKSTKPGMISYEDYIVYVVWLVSLALDASFAAKLRRATRRFGAAVEVKPAPVKTLARMRNKLADPDHHALKQRPRPMHNLDTVRAGVVVTDPAIMEDVFDAIEADVGPWLRVKNNYRAEFDAVDSYGYRALIGNLKHSSGMVCSELFEGGPETDDVWNR